MFAGASAIACRTLRVDARGSELHLTRCVLLVTILVWLYAISGAADRMATPGLRFCRGLAYLSAFFVTLLGGMYFSSSITEEKEEKSLGLLLLAGISPLQILIGKLAGRLIQALLLIAVQYPLGLLAVTMGGITFAQVTAVYVGLAAYTVMLAGFGLLCSTLSSNSRNASGWMIFGLIFYLTAPYFVQPLQASLVNSSLQSGSQPTLAMALLDWAASVSFLRELEATFATDDPMPIGKQVISNIVLGAAFIGLAWLLFGIGVRTVDAERSSRGLVSHRSKLFGWFSSGRAWKNAVVWKDFYFIAGGTGGLAMRLTQAIVLWFGLVYCELAIFPGTWNWYRIIGFYQAALMMIMIADTTVLLVKSLQAEIVDQTLPLLLLLPQRTATVVQRKFHGVLLINLPLVLINLILLATAEGRDNLSALTIDNQWVLIVATVLLVVHLSLALSVFLRWTAVPLGLILACTFGGILVNIQGSATKSHTTDLICLTMALLVCLACHVVICKRLIRLGSVS